MRSMITNDGTANTMLAEGVSIIGASLMVKDTVSFEDMELALKTLVTMDRITQWCMGDAVNASERIFGEKYSQMLNITGLNYGYLMTCASMANAFPPDQRMNISFSHHRVVQKYDATVRRKYLQVGIDQEMDLRTFTKYVNEREGKGKSSTEDNRKKDYVVATRTAPVQRAHIWEILEDEDAINIDAEQLESLGIKPFTSQDTVVVICVRFKEEMDPNMTQADLDLKDADANEETADPEVPFG